MNKMEDNDRRNMSALHRHGQQMASMGPLERSTRTGMLLAASFASIAKAREEVSPAMEKFNRLSGLHSMSGHGHAEA